MILTISVVDILAVIIILITAIASSKDGFFRIVASIGAYIAALFCARVIANPVSSFLYEKAVRAKMIAHLEDLFAGGQSVIMSVTQSLPEKVAKLADFFRLITGPDTIDSALSVDKIEADIISPVTIKVLTIIVTVILFTVFSIFFRVLVHALNSLIFKKKHGLLAFTNKVLGLIFGFIKGILPVALLCELLNIATPLIENSFLTKSVASSYICTFLAGLIK